MLLPLALLPALLAPLRTPPAPQAPEDPFPPSTALAEGLDPEALERLDARVRERVEDGSVVGAELLVIRHGRTVLHTAHGWRDREAEVPMEPGGVFCVRSMTKPLIGAAVMMLVEDRALRLDDPIAQHLPMFDVEGKRGITVEQLLTHTSGLPMSHLIGADLSTIEGIQQVARLGAERPLQAPPGSAVIYSDQGTDTLTALVEVASGMPAEDFVRTRLLEPLGMADSACLLPEDHPLRARACSKYVGSKGSWTRYWKPDDAPLFPCFLGSQGLYSTLEDYARFLQLFLDRGRVGKERLLRSRSVRHVLTPGPFPMGAPTGLPGLRGDYGSLMQLWTAPDPDAPEDELAREVVAFGHNGSDGTYAWAFPEQDALVLYFTQSRGTPTGIELEEVLGDLLLGVPFDPNVLAPPLEQYLGYYQDAPDDLYRALVVDDGELAIEVVGRGIAPLVYLGEDRWRPRNEPNNVIEFERDEAGAVVAFRVGDHREYRFEPADDLPSEDDLAARVAEAHGLARLAEVGPLHLEGTVTLQGQEGTLDLWFAAPDRFRNDFSLGEQFERTAYDGEVVRSATSLAPLAPLDEERARAVRHDNFLARFGDWGTWFGTFDVVQRYEAEGMAVVLVRMGDPTAPAVTYMVEEATGRVVVQGVVQDVPGLGRVGSFTRFGDFRDVGGLLLPHRIGTEFSAMVKLVLEVRIEAAHTGVELPEGHFALAD